jgi:hypothetical protein
VRGIFRVASSRLEHATSVLDIIVKMHAFLGCINSHLRKFGLLLLCRELFSRDGEHSRDCKMRRIGGEEVGTRVEEVAVGD